MSLKPDPAGVIPEETAHIAKAVFRKGNAYFKLLAAPYYVASL